MMLGIVLCGGQSLRMGKDKGLLIHHGKLWARSAGEKLESLGLEVRFSINNFQEENYARYLSSDYLIKDHVSLDLKGPLLGLMSAHLRYPLEDLFLLACDLLSMEAEVLKKICELKRMTNEFDAYVFTINGEREPLCGIYTAAGLNKVLILLRTGKLIKHSMKFVLANLIVAEIIVEDKDFRFLKNFNFHTDVDNYDGDNSV